jgi:hypothetical protein
VTATVTAALAAALALAAAGCARKLPPPGGTPDLVPPRLASTVPDSGAVGVPRGVVLELRFSEAMAHRDPVSWFCTGPYVSARRVEWRKNTLFFEPAESLRADQTYTLIVGGAATDARGNRLAGVRTLPFTTGAAFPPGRLGGRVEGRGHTGDGVFVWAYREDLGHAPDSTARDFDALAIGGPGGQFVLPGLPVPSRWRLYAFHDANRTLSFEPDVDHLTRQDSVVVLTAEAPAADSLVIWSVDPAAPATVSGTVVDSLVPPGTQVRVLAERVGAEAAGSPRGGRAARSGSVAVEGGTFRLSLEAGRYRLRVYLDLNRNARFDSPAEPASEPVEIDAKAGDVLSGIELVAPAGPPEPAPSPGGKP